MLIKHNIAHKFQLIPNNNIDSIWIKTSKTPQDKEICLGFYYCSPEVTNMSNFVEVVNHEVDLYNNKENTFIFRDLNSLIKTENETIIQDKYGELFDIEIDVQTKPLSRNSEDMRLINQRGKEFLDICRINNIIVVNGRKIGDIFGKYTCHQKNGPSVVDYMVTTQCFPENLSL